MKYKCFLFAMLTILLCGGPAYSGDLYTETDETVNGAQVRVAHLTLHPAPEPVPAMKYRLITDPAYQVERNANIHYLKVGGFFEQGPSLERIQKKIDETEKYAESDDPELRRKYVNEWPDSSPDDLPLDEVKEVLGWLRFQPSEFAEAERCRFADFGRQNVFEMESPFNYLLPEIQSMRKLARWQSVRCKVAIREGRLDDAIKILRQQYVMSMHLGQDVFAVSNLVGIAIGGIADHDLLYLIQKPDAPSLYWAVAAIPRPLCNIQQTLSVEKRTIRAYFPNDKKLRDLDYRFPEGHWDNYAEETLGKLLSTEVLEGSNIPKPFSWEEFKTDPQASAATFVTAAYPQAKRYLIEDHKLDRKKIDSFPAVRVVAMALGLALDDLFELEQKYTTLPPEHYIALTKNSNRQIHDRVQRIGLAAHFIEPLLCATKVMNHAVIRQQQNFNIIQTIEALRLYAYHNDGKLPNSIEKLNPPAMKNPFTGEHFPYRVDGGKAILDVSSPRGYYRRYVIEMKPIEK